MGRFAQPYRKQLIVNAERTRARDNHLPLLSLCAGLDIVTTTVGVALTSMRHSVKPGFDPDTKLRTEPSVPVDVMGSDLDPTIFWTAIGKRPVGATVVTSAGHNGSTGFLALSFAHVSSAPPTVLVSASKMTSALETILESQSFAVNVLAKGGQPLAQAFGRGGDMAWRFALAEWEQFVTGAPVLRQAAAVFDCALKQTIEETSSVILIGSVAGLRLPGGKGATVAYRNGYRDFGGD